MYNTDDHWKQWGEQDPYFAALSQKKFRKENIESNRKEFFAVWNVDFVKSDDHLSWVAQKFDFVTSCLVLQHIPPKRGMTIISRLLKVLNLGGVIALQFPVRHRLPPAERFVYMVKQNLPFTRYCFNLMQARRLSEPLMQMNEYNLIEVMALGSGNGIREFALHTHQLNGTLSVILIGRKDA